MKEKTNKENNKTISQELLDSYRTALYKVKDYFVSVSSHEFTIEDTQLAESILKLGEKLGKNIETLGILENKVEKEESLKDKRRGNSKDALFENG